jgi:hypothetical protein
MITYTSRFPDVNSWYTEVDGDIIPKLSLYITYQNDSIIKRNMTIICDFFSKQEHEK